MFQRPLLPRLCHLAFLAVAVLLVTGCPRRLPGSGPQGEDQALNVFGVDGNEPAAGMAMDPIDGGGETSSWTSLDDPVPAGAPSNAAATDQRWEGVAIYFAYDRASIGSAEREKLETLASFLAERPGYEVVIEGHADSRGSDEYNRGLSERRALAVKDYLMDLGIADGRLQTIAYGEDKPAVPGATSEAEHARNRRVEFVFRIPR